jgi:hypothetical protein
LRWTWDRNFRLFRNIRNIRNIRGADRVTTVMVVTAVVVALVEFIGRKSDTTPSEGCAGQDGCFAYRGGVPVLVAAGGMVVLGIALRVLEVRDRDRIAYVLFPAGLACVVGLRYVRYLLDRSIGVPETLFPSTFEWMAADDLVLAAIAAFAALVTEPTWSALNGKTALNWNTALNGKSVARVLVGLLLLAGLWSVLIVVHGDPLRG